MRNAIPHLYDFVIKPWSDVPEGVQLAIELPATGSTPVSFVAKTYKKQKSIECISWLVDLVEMDGQNALTVCGFPSYESVRVSRVVSSGEGYNVLVSVLVPFNVFNDIFLSCAKRSIMEASIMTTEAKTYLA